MEIRTIVIFKPNSLNVPSGDYELVEMFYDDEDCDCKRVMITVILSVTQKAVAVITFRWRQNRFKRNGLTGAIIRAFPEFYNDQRLQSS